MFGLGYLTLGAYNREVRQAVRTRIDESLIERGQGIARFLRSEFDFDPFGNLVFEWKHGDLGHSSDDLYTHYEYARNEELWLADRISRIFQTDGGPGGAFASDTINH